MPLTEDAQKAIQEAIAIIREDRFEKFARGSLARNVPKEDVKPDPKDELIITDEDKEKVKAPPEKEKEAVIDEQPKKHSKYWGEILE